MTSAEPESVPEQVPEPTSSPTRRPAFAASFPRTPELDALVGAFARGDYARVRDEAPKLAASSDDPEVRRAARLLRARIEADPLAVWLLGLTGVLLAILTGWWIAHGHAPAGTGAAPPPPAVEHVR